MCVCVLETRLKAFTVRAPAHVYTIPFLCASAIFFSLAEMRLWLASMDVRCVGIRFESMNSKHSVEHNHTHIIHFKWNIKWKWIASWEWKINTNTQTCEREPKKNTKQRNQRGQKIELIAHLFGDAAGIFAIVCIWQIMRIEHVSLSRYNMWVTAMENIAKKLCAKKVQTHIFFLVPARDNEISVKLFSISCIKCISATNSSLPHASVDKNYKNSLSSVQAIKKKLFGSRRKLH